MPTIRATAGLFALAALAAVVPRSAEAEIYRPWCAQYYGFGGGGTNCGFISYEQCMMTAQGAGAWCVQNPWYSGVRRRQPEGCRHGTAHAQPAVTAHAPHG